MTNSGVKHMQDVLIERQNAAKANVGKTLNALLDAVTESENNGLQIPDAVRDAAAAARLARADNREVELAIENL